MNVLMVADVLPDWNKGASGTELQTAKALRSLGCKVDCIWGPDLRHRIQHGNLHYVAELPWSYRDAIAERLSQESFDVIHVNQPHAWLAARWFRQANQPGVFVNRSHGWEPRVESVQKPWRKQYAAPEWRWPRGIVGRPLQKILWRYARCCAETSDGIIVSCEEDAEFIRSEYRIGSERIACIPQAATESFLKECACPMDVTRAKKVLYVGQTCFVKGPDVLAEIFSLLAERDGSFELTWCCDAADHEACRSRLSAQARARTTFVDWMPQDSLIELYDKHGIFLFPSFAEGFGKAFVEAMARGLCVFASDSSGMRDVIHHGHNGFLFPTGDATACVENILGQASLSRLIEVSDAAAATARSYSWERVGRETLGFYEGLLRRKKAKSSP